MSNNKTAYELGLVVAGAVSAGAYAAGVVDFLIEALDEWHRAKRERPDEVPDHEVRLKVIAGSSAGGMTGAIAAALSGNHVPVTSLPGSEPSDSVLEANEFYSAWVEQIDIRPLLGDWDLSGSKNTVPSLLDSSILDEIAETAVDFSPRNENRAYVADPLHLLLTVTNLRGAFRTTSRSRAIETFLTARPNIGPTYRLQRICPQPDGARRGDPALAECPRSCVVRLGCASAIRTGHRCLPRRPGATRPESGAERLRRAGVESAGSSRGARFDAVLDTHYH